MDRRTIWKFEVDLADDFTLTMPSGARILHVERQGQQPCLWALVDPESTPVARHFHVRGTGQPIPEGVDYVATWVALPFVWHLFERK